MLDPDSWGSQLASEGGRPVDLRAAVRDAVEAAARVPRVLLGAEALLRLGADEGEVMRVMIARIAASPLAPKDPPLWLQIALDAADEGAAAPLVRSVSG